MEEISVELLKVVELVLNNKFRYLKSLIYLQLQSDSSNIADAVHSWLTLYNSQTFSNYKNKVISRMNLAIAPFFFVAYLLHPRYQGMNN